MLNKIIDAFGDCSSNASLCDHRSSYQSINALGFFVFDPPTENNQPCKIVNQEEDFQLTVEGNNKTIVFIKSDKCLFQDNESKCDCILLNDEKVFFVEIKSVSKKNRSKSRNDAIKQLGATILRFKNKNLMFEGMSKQAVICFKFISKYPIRTSEGTNKEIFRQNYGFELVEGNSIVF